MKPFKITYESRPKKKYSNWISWSINWFCLIYGTAIAGYAGYEYYYELDTFNNSLYDLFVGILFFLLGYLNLSEKPIPEITIKAEGIELNSQKKSQLFKWSQIKELKISNNTITLHLENDDQEELDVWYLEYTDLQTVKSKLKVATKEKNVVYHSKY